MGVRGLKSFFERENQIRVIKIDDEVQKWRRQSPNRKPIIVIDFLCLTNGFQSSDPIDTICGGRHQIILNAWIQLLNVLKAMDCALVFFSDLNIQMGKIDEWLSRRNNEFDYYTNLYDAIVSGKSLSTIVAEQVGNGEKRSITSVFYGMAVIAHQYGEFFFSTKHEADLELAQYAKNHEAMAVISDDTDFLIFEGSWRLWSAQNIQITPTNQLKTLEYNRQGIANKLALSTHQLPLFATLMGNDFTKPYFNELSNLYKQIGGFRNKIQNIARFIRNMNQDINIRRIVQLMCGSANNEMEQLIKNSIDSYNTDFLPAIPSDPIEMKLLHTNMYRPYMGNMGLVHGLTMPFYDMRGYVPTHTNLANLLTDWIKRRKGVVLSGRTDSSSFTLLARRSFHEKCMAHAETLTRPDCFSVPSLAELYSESIDSELNEVRWKIFMWITSLNDDEISGIKQLPKKFLMISTILYILVKNQLISVDMADGILCTEHAVYENATMNVEYPIVVVAGHIRAAHIYNITFSAMRQNFAIAGLLPIIQEVLQFDGVYFQKLMEKVIMMSATERDSLLAPIQNYRIYNTVK